MVTLKELGNLSGRRALITGATGNLGSVFASTLAELGAELILIDKKGSDFDTLATEIQKQQKSKLEIHVCNLEDEHERSALIALLIDSHKSLDVLINNAAFVGSDTLTGWNTDFEDQSVDTWRRAIEVNLTAVFHLCQGLAPLLRNSEGGSIINIGSIYGSLAPDWGLYAGTEMGNPAAYGVSKAGLMQLTRWLSSTLAPDIRVNAISPGGIYRNQPQEFVDRYEKKTPLKRMATEDDIRGAVALLSSDLSCYITGQVLCIDGGFGII